MNIALVSGLIILILLVIMLIAGVPIAVALGISSVVAILPIMDLEVAVVTGAHAFSPVFPCSACWQSHSLSWPAIL